MTFRSRLLIATSVLALFACTEEIKKAETPGNDASITGRQEVSLRLAHATEAAGDYVGAEKLFLQVVTQSPKSPAPQLELADFYKRHHEDAKAIRSLNEALKIQPNNSDIERDLANMYINTAEPEKALVLLDKAVATDKTNPLLYNSRGVALDQIGSFTEAQKSYNIAYNLDPADGTMYKVNLSMSYILARQYDKAINLLRPMMDQAEAPPIIRQNLALAYGLKGESDTALKLGLRDLSDSEAEENVRFYQMLARTHEQRLREQQHSGEAVPASVVNELFPGKEEPVTAPAPAETAEMPDTGMTAVVPQTTIKPLAAMPVPVVPVTTAMPPAIPAAPQTTSIPAPPASMTPPPPATVMHIAPPPVLAHTQPMQPAPMPVKTIPVMKVPPTNDAAVTPTEEEDDDTPVPAPVLKTKISSPNAAIPLANLSPSSGGRHSDYSSTVTTEVAPGEGDSAVPVPVLKPDSY